MELSVDENIADLSILELSISRPEAPKRLIFPRLERLKIVFDNPQYALLRLATIFLHDAIKHLRFDSTNIHVGDRNFAAAVFLVGETARLCPNVDHVDFMATAPADCGSLQFLADSRRFLPGWRSLRTFCAPGDLLTFDIMIYLANSEALEEVSSLNDIESGDPAWELRRRIVNFTPQFQAHAFTKLSQLELSDTIEGASLFFSSSHVYPSLESFCLTSRWSNDGEHMGNFLQKLSVACPRLKGMEITRSPYPEQEVPKEDQEGIPIDYQSLNALTQFSNLETFCLTHAWPVRVNNEELTQLVCNCPAWSVIAPALRILHLNSHAPLPTTTTSITLKVLKMLSERCPPDGNAQIILGRWGIFGERRHKA